MSMLGNVKIVLGISDDSKDSLLNYYITSTTQKVLNYCNIEALPQQLENTVEQIVVSIMLDGQVSKDQKDNTVKSITRGDTRVEYDISASTITDKTITDLLTNYYKQMNAFRILRK